MCKKYHFIFLLKSELLSSHTTRLGESHPSHLGIPFIPRIVTGARKGKGPLAAVSPSADQVTVQAKGLFCAVLGVCSWGEAGTLATSDRLLQGPPGLTASLGGARSLPLSSSPQEISSSAGRHSLHHPASLGPLCHFLKFCPTWWAQDLGKQKPRCFRLVAFCSGTFLPPASVGKGDNSGEK